MSKTTRIFALLMIVATFVIIVQASTIIRSRSNISNNRRAFPIGGSPESGPGDAVVLCSSCTYPGLPEEGCLILMDNQTGEIWAYCDNAVVGNAAPQFLGTLAAVGKPIAKTHFAPPPPPK